MLDTQKQKHLKEPVHVLDIFLFINPIDANCHKCATEILHYTKLLEQKTYFHFIPYHNLKTVDIYLKKNQLSTTDLQLRNQIHEACYLLALTYKAASLQGKNKALAFFDYFTELNKSLQHRITDTHILQAATAADLDIDMLLDDRQSQSVKKLYKQDQDIANHFSISCTPSIVIFDSCESNGILLEEDISIEHLQHALAYYDVRLFKKWG